MKNCLEKKSVMTQRGLSLIELVIAMSMLGLGLLAYELVLLNTKTSLNIKGNSNQVVDLANDRFNEFIATNTLKSGSTSEVSITSSGSTMVFTSANDNQVTVSLSL